MSPPDNTLDLLAQEMFAPVPYVSCANGYRQFVKNFAPASQHIPELYNIVPDNVYRPEVYVAFDFASRFALQFDLQSTTAAAGGAPSSTSTRIQGQNLVSSEVLLGSFTKLLEYMEYYYGYILTYAANSAKQSQNFQQEMRKMRESPSPDEIVAYINKVINIFFTSVSINRVRNDISTCNITFRDSPQYTGEGKKVHLFFMDGFPLFSQLFVPMLPFTIWAKGRIYSDFMFPIFTGYITRITPANDQGFTSFKVDGRDVLELARIVQENLNPALVQLAEPSHQPLNFFSKPFYGVDHMQIVRSMFMGGVLEYDENLQRVIGISSIHSNTKSSAPKFYPIGTFVPADEDPGHTTPDQVMDNRYAIKEEFNITTMLNHLRKPRYIVSWGYNLTPYRTFATDSPDVYTSAFSNRLEVLKNVADAVYYEFYTDGAGNVHYHPMRLGNDFLTYDSFYPVDAPIGGALAVTKATVKEHKHSFPYAQVVSDHEATSVSKTHNIEELVTYLVLRGVPPVEEMAKDPREIGLIGFSIDIDKLSKFGYRRREIGCSMLNDNVNIKDKDGSVLPLFSAMAKVFMDYANGGLYTMTGSYIFRPELEMCLPIYLVEQSEIFYVQSLAHTIEVGSNAATVVNASFGRQEDEPEVDLISYMLKTEMLRKSDLSQIRYIGSRSALQKNLDFIIPFAAYTQYKDNVVKRLNANSKNASFISKQTEKIRATHYPNRRK